MASIAELHQAAVAYSIVRVSEIRGKATALDNFQFISTQSAFCDDTPRNLLSIALQSGLYLKSGWPWWTCALVGHAASVAARILYSLVRNSGIYFFGKTSEAVRLDGSELDDFSANEELDESGIIPHVDQSPHEGETFRHTPLGGSEFFRCLLLKSSRTKDAVIECELYRLSIDTPAIYEAVSYCWGDQTPTETILCDDKRFFVTKNCMAILKQLRRKWVGRLLWIDAICIDQTKEAERERNMQLQIMGHIYSQATKVIIWLGPSTPESRLAFRYLRFLEDMMILPSSLQDLVRERLLKKIILRNHGYCMRDTSRRPWYSRVWTVQEVAMARQGCCTIYCGEDNLNYDWFNANLFSMTTDLHIRDDYGLNDLLQEPRNHLRRSLRHMILSKCQVPPTGLPHMLKFLLCYHSSDPKDKIFAFYGLFKSIGLKMPPPNYGATCGAVYWTATLAFLRQEPCTVLLTLASGVASKMPEVPTWVPDFRMNNHAMFKDEKFSASGASLPRLEILDGGRSLKVSGKIIDKVMDRSNDRLKVWEPQFGTTSFIDSRYFGLDDIHKFMPTILVLQDFINFSLAQKTNLRYRREGADIYHVLAETYTQGRMDFLGLTSYDFALWSEMLTANQDWIPRPGKQSLEDFLQQAGGAYHSSELSTEIIEKWENLSVKLSANSRGEYSLEKSLRTAKDDPEMKRRFFNNPDLQPLTEIPEWQILCAMKMNPDSARMMHLVWAMTRGNMLFSTKQERLGSASRTLIVGDEIALIQGVNSPMVLRPVQTPCGKRYQVVGPAYVHGVMNGELWERGGSETEDLILI